MLDLKLTITVGGQAIRYTQCKTQPHAALSRRSLACLSTMHMYEFKLSKTKGVENHSKEMAVLILTDLSCAKGTISIYQQCFHFFFKSSNQSCSLLEHFSLNHLPRSCRQKWENKSQ